jgi:hypothetical protein
MESFKKMRGGAWSLFLTAGAWLFAGCALFSQDVVIQDPLVLEEIAPLPRTMVVKPVLEYEPVYTLMRIIEVSEVNGVQKFFLARAGADRKNIAEGSDGDISDEEEFKKIIGNFTIIEMAGDFFRCEVRQLDYKIGQNAFIRVQTGERIKK